MRKHCVASLAVVLVACAGDPLGKPCKIDGDCGPGFDCYPDVCVPVCTKSDECPQGQTCYRYHCIVPGQERTSPARPVSAPGPSAPAVALPPPRPTGPPPLPDTTAAELRAIRRELELLAAEQAKLTAAVEALRQSLGKPSKPTGPATPR